MSKIRWVDRDQCPRKGSYIIRVLTDRPVIKMPAGDDTAVAVMDDSSAAGKGTGHGQTVSVREGRR